MAKYWLFRFAAWLVPLVPLVLARPLVQFGGTLAWVLAPGMRRRVERNQRHLPTPIEDPAALHRAARGVFQTAA